MRSTAAPRSRGGMDEFYGRNMPDASVGRDASSCSLSQLYGALRADLRRGRDRVLLAPGRLVVGDERRAGDRAPPRRAGVLPARRRGARAARARPHGCGDGRGAPPEARVAAGRPAVRPAGGDRRRGARDRRRSRTRSAGSGSTSGRACCGRTARRSTASGPRASTRAASRPAATRAASPRRSCSASRRRRTPRAEPWSGSGFAGESDSRVSLADREHAAARVAGERRGADLVHDEQRGRRPRARADARRVALLLAQRVAGGRPDEEEVAVPVSSWARSLPTGRVRRQRHARSASPASPRSTVDRAVQLLDALLDRLERAPPPLRLGVVGDRRRDAAVRRSRAMRDRDPARAARAGSPGRAARG